MRACSHFRRLCLAILGLGLGVLTAAEEAPWRFAVKKGEPREVVVRTYGTPKSAARSGDREILVYAEGRVVLVDGKVVEMIFAKSEPRFFEYTQDRGAAPAAVAAAPGNNPGGTLATPKAPNAAESSPWLGFWLETRRLAAHLWSQHRPAVYLVSGSVVLLLLAWFWHRRHPERHIAPPPPRPAPRDDDASPPLQDLEWKRFRETVADYFRHTDWRAEPVAGLATDGVDIRLYRGSEQTPAAVVSCKGANDLKVSVKPVRELYGTMATSGFAEGWFVALGGFTPEAIAFAEGKKLHLLDGEEFIRRIRALPAAAQNALLTAAFRGDYLTPTCPACDVKMVLRQSEGVSAWRCPNPPRCTASFPVRVPRS